MLFTIKEVIQMSEAYFKDVDVLKGPILAMLKKEGYQAVDMHYHTRFSVDGMATIEQVINKCKKDSIGVAVTDHNHIKGAFKAKKLAGKDVFTIPGMELTCHNGVHILLHFYSTKDLKEFYEKELKQKLKISPWFIPMSHEEVVEAASKYKCLITAPHPFGPGFIGIKKFHTNQKIINKLHAIEAINGCCIGDMNTKAIAWGKKIKKPFTGGSDGHCLAELGTSLTICKAKTVKEFLDQVKKGNSIIIGKEEKLLEDAVHAVGKFIHEEKMVPHKQMEQMWKDRGLLEWNYFKKKISDSHFFHHFMSHHSDLSKKKLKEHKHTKHLAKIKK
jgi:predicted metal-dependent phosphoesterase TrpH